MTLRARVLSLMMSLLLPVLAVALLVFFTTATVLLSANDRAIVWAEGTPSQLQAMAERVASNPWFSYGRSVGASDLTPLPEECPNGAREFSFSSLGEFEAQAAQDILRQIASEAGAEICLDNVFIINELPDPQHQTAVQAVAAHILNASLLPLALVFIAFLALAGRLRLAGVWHVETSLWQTAGVVLLAASTVSLLLFGADFISGPATTGAGGSLSVANVGLALAFGLVVTIPMLEEVAFRAWMLPLAQRAVGTAAAAGLSSALYAAANIPQSVGEGAAYFAVGLVYAALYLRTKSLLACIVANIFVSGFRFWID